MTVAFILHGKNSREIRFLKSKPPGSVVGVFEALSNYLPKAVLGKFCVENDRQFTFIGEKLIRLTENCTLQLSTLLVVILKILDVHMSQVVEVKLLYRFLSCIPSANQAKIEPIKYLQYKCSNNILSLN